jgi:alpha-soluble NSF attachment protein
MTDTDLLRTKAQSLLTTAERKVDNIENTWIHFLTPKSHKYESAAEFFTAAAKQFQLARAYTDAGKAYLRATDCYQHSEFSRYNIAQCYAHASQNFRQQDIKAAIIAMEKAILIFAEDGRFSQAARYEKELAELYENEFSAGENLSENIAHAIRHYEIAAEYFEMEGSKITAAECLSKVVPLYALLGNYHKAIEVLEKTSEIGKFRLKENCLKSAILYLCLPDTVAVKRAVFNWEMKYSELKGTREMEFMNEIVSAALETDQDRYKKAIADWNRVLAMDSWKMKYLEVAEGKLFEEENFT